MRIDSLRVREVGPFRDQSFAFPRGKAPDLAEVHIFVGPNGCGKSTILYSLASVFEGLQRPIGELHAHRRMHGESSRVEVTMATTEGIVPPDDVIVLQPETGWRAAGGSNRNLEVVDAQHGFVLTSTGRSAVGRYCAVASDYLLEDARHRALQRNGLRFSWAAFAYSGTRAFSQYRLQSLAQEIATSPFERSLSFVNTASAQSLADWMASMFAKRAIALEQGNPAQATRYRAAIEAVENLVAEVSGEELRFRMSYEPLGIVVEKDGRELSLDVLAEGLISMVTWISDLIMRLDRIPWVNEAPVLSREFALFLDEIDVHLHPAWQRKVLVMAQKAFPNAQIFVSTHSPLVVASVSGAWVYPLKVQGGAAICEEPVPSQAGVSVPAVLRSLFGVTEEFDEETERGFRSFYELRDRVLAGESKRFDELRASGESLAARGEEVRAIISEELQQVASRLGRSL
jgi:predicted ATP-binding protein involved in virulence